MIRTATPADAPALSTLQRHLSEPNPDLLEYALGAGDVLVSTADGGPVGYVLAVPGDGPVYVAELVVAPDHRREGRATALLDAVVADAERVTLTVAPDNEAARSLYRKRGFEEVRRVPDFFEDGPALLLAR